MRAEAKNTQTTSGNLPISLGVGEDGGYYEFTVFLPGTGTCELRIYDLEKGEAAENLSLFAMDKMPGIFRARLKKEGLPDCFGYRYAVEGKEFLDPYVKHIVGRENFGMPGECFGTADERMAYRYYAKKNGWTAPYHPYSFVNDNPPRLAYQDMIMYKLHVRGFTMTAPGVRHRGTYRGLLEKKPYLLELGVNALLLMPCVEFDEVLSGKEIYGGLPAYAKPLRDLTVPQEGGAGCRINYWGFAKESSYFAPKASYASKPCLASSEFKEMVAGMHESGIEVLLEMNFQPTDNPNLIRDCLVFWVSEYHVDGFRYNTSLYPAHMAALCPELAGIKILSTGFGDIGEIRRVSGFGEGLTGLGIPFYKHAISPCEPEYKAVLAEYNEGFLQDIRRFVKGDEEMVGAVAARLERQCTDVGIINYVADHNGFTLADVYAYDVKHNEANGEENRDGTDYNFSWNCGAEGATKKKKILKLRSRMRRNALILLFTSLGTPMLLAGDEFGNSQAGNNNAYCQDNETGWVSWRELRANKDQFEFVKQLIALRREHPVLRNKRPLKGMDYISCGCPDVSRHGTKAWYPDYSNYSRTLAMLFCGKYAMVDGKSTDQSIYIAANMHWEPHVFDLPDISDGEELTFLLCSDRDCTKSGDVPPEKAAGIRQRTFEVPARSVALFIGKNCKKNTETQEKTGRDVEKKESGI